MIHLVDLTCRRANLGAGANAGERRSAACFNPAVTVALPGMAQLGR
jgi:hypothetical protein